MKIGFIGVGNMGSPMAAHLAAAGHEVTGHDIVTSMPDGVKTAGTGVEAVKGAEVVITMLPAAADVEEVASQVIPAMDKGSLFIDGSTAGVACATRVAEIAKAHGVRAMDAPVSGGIGGAHAATLTFMVGGDKADFDACKDLFSLMGQKAVYCGETGKGQAVKICNNMIAGVSMVVTCEAIALADKLGLDRETVFDVVSTSTGKTWVMNDYCPMPGVGPKTPSDNDYKPGFTADLMIKDLRLSQDAAKSVDADTPMGARATEVFAQYVEQEDGSGRDFSAMLTRFEKRGRG
jgi:3-hydroxyisobutyrate dehydrogenase